MRKFWRVLPAAAGLLVVLLIVGGCCALFNQKPIPQFTWEPAFPEAGQVVRFNGSSSYDPDDQDQANRGVAKYEWDFGDGVIDSDAGPTPNHVFQDDGVYPVTLTVFDRFGASASLTVNLEVSNPGPKIEEIRIYDSNGCRYEAGDNLRFEVKALDPASTGAKTISEVLWDFGDGTTASGSVVWHCYSQGCRNYRLSVKVTDDDGAFATYQKTIYIYCKNEPPTPIIRILPSSVFVGTKVTFDGSGSHDNNRCCVPCSGCFRDCSAEELAPECDGCYQGCGAGRVVSWRWWIKPPCQDWIFIGYGSKVSYTPQKTGVFRVRLEIKDGDECEDGKACCNWVGVETEFEVLSCSSDCHQTVSQAGSQTATH